MPRFVSVGEAIVELIGDGGRGYKLSLVGDSLEMALGVRRHLGVDWTVDYFTALGGDIHSQAIVDRLAQGGVGIGHVLKVAGRSVGLSLVTATEDGPVVTDWRGQAAARLMAEDRELLRAAFDGAGMICVSGAAFAILSPRARGRLLKALYQAREAGARIVLVPHEWPDQWTSRRVMGSAINAAATVADAVITTRSLHFGETSAEAIAARYHEWGVEEVLIRTYRDGAFASNAGAGRWVDLPGLAVEGSARYLAARLGGASPLEAALAAK